MFYTSSSSVLPGIPVLPAPARDSALVMKGFLKNLTNDLSSGCTAEIYRANDGVLTLDFHADNVNLFGEMVNARGMEIPVHTQGRNVFQFAGTFEHTQKDLGADYTGAPYRETAQCIITISLGDDGAFLIYSIAPVGELTFTQYGYGQLHYAERIVQVGE